MSWRPNPSAASSAPVPMGGATSDVVRIGDTVRRTVSPSSPAVHALLRHLESDGFAGAPRFHGIDDEGREILSYVDGVTLDTVDMPELSLEALAATGQIIRAFHDVVRSFFVTDDLSWGYPPVADVPGELIICHNDISPRNTVFRDGFPVALIDWELAHPSPAIWDVAHAVWQFAIARHHGKPPCDVDDCLRRIACLLDGYGLSDTMREGFADILALRVERSRTGIAALAEAGEPAFIRFRDQDVLEDLADDLAWIIRHRSAITASLVE